MTTPTDTLIENATAARPRHPGAAAAQAVSAAPPDSKAVPGRFLWRAMGGLCLLWLVVQEWAVLGAWPPSLVAGAGWLGTAALAALMMLPSLFRPSEGWRRAISSTSALVILGAFAAASGTPGDASGEGSPLPSLAGDLLESGLLPALALLALGFSLPPLLARASVPASLSPTAAGRGWKMVAATALPRGLDVLAASAGLLGLCYVPQSSPDALPARLLAAGATVAAAALAAGAARYRGGLVLESPERGIEFLIPERLVRRLITAALFALLGADLLAAFRASGPTAVVTLPFLLWVAARTSWPLLCGDGWGEGEGRHDGETSGVLRGCLGLCTGAVAALSGLLCCRAAGLGAPDPFTPPCLLLALAAAGAAALGAGRTGERVPGAVSGRATLAAAASGVAATVRLRGEPRPLPASAALPLLGPRGARLLASVLWWAAALGRVGRGLDRFGRGLDRGLAAAVAGVRPALRRVLAGPWPALVGRAGLALAACWLALKDWLASDAQDYPALASLVVTLSVLGAALAARSVRRCGPWRDLLLAGGAALCLLALALPDAPPLISDLVPAAGLLTLALALPRLLPAPWPMTAVSLEALEGEHGAEAEPGQGRALRGLKGLLQNLKGLLRKRLDAGQVLGAAARGLRRVLTARIETGRLSGAAARSLRAMVAPVDYGRLLGEGHAVGRALGRAKGLLQTRVGEGSVPGAAARGLRRVLTARVEVRPLTGAARRPAEAPEGAGSGRGVRLLGHAPGFLGKEVTLPRAFTGRAARVDVRPPLSGRITVLPYWGAALLGMTTLLLTPAGDTLLMAGALPSLLAAAGAVVLLVFCARSPRPAARAVPFIVWGLCAVLYAWAAVPAGSGASPSDVRGMLIGRGLSDHLAWDVPTFLSEQGWAGWALAGLLLLWALDRSAQAFASRAGGAAGAGTADAQAAERLGGRPNADLELSAVELSAGATAAVAALLLNGAICLPILALCVASLVIGAGAPGGASAAEASDASNTDAAPDASDAVDSPGPRAAGRAGGLPRAKWSPWHLATRRPASLWLALAGAALVVAGGALCFTAWSLSDEAGRLAAAPAGTPTSVPKVLRDAVPGDLPPASSWRDGYALLRRCFGSRVAVPPSLSAAVAAHVTGADRSPSLPRAAAAALLAPLVGDWLTPGQLEALYLSDRDYGLPASEDTGLAAATAYYFRRRPADLSPADARFLVGEQPASGALPLRLPQDGPAPAFVPLGAPQFHFETFSPPVGYDYAHHDGSVNGRGEFVTSVITGGGARSYVREGGRIQMLNGLGGPDASAFVVKINDRGQAAGWSTGPDGSEHAVLWGADGRCRDLGTLPGYTDSRARGVNDRGQVVGYAFNDANVPDLEKPSRPFLWEDGRMRDLGTPPGCTGGRAYAVNDAGQAAGWVVTADGTHAAVWEDGRVHDLGAFPGGNVSAADAVNDAGQVVGSAQHKDGRVTAFLWQDGIMHDLGALPGDTYSSARDVSNLGQVVGVSRTDRHVDFGGGGSFVWDGVHGMRDLTSLMAAPPSLRGTLPRNCQPYAINDRGQVLGLWFAPSTRLTFLMTPGAQDDRDIALRPVPGRSYRLVSAGSGAVADVAGGSRAAGAGVIQWRPNGGANQEWTAQDLGGGSWGFVNRGSDRCLAVAAGTPSAPVVQGAPFAGGGGTPGGAGGGRYQQWGLRPQLDGSFEFVNRGSGLSMDVWNRSTSDGATIDQWHSTGNANQRWLLQPVK